jgi:hypothetical protein
MERCVKDLLVQQVIVKALYGTKPEGMADIYWKKLQAKAMATIQLCLGDDVMYHVMDEESPTAVWLKLYVKLKDKDKALMLLNLLPTSSMYENLVTTLTWGKETMELKDVTGAPLAFHQRKKNIDGSFQG